MGLVRALPSSDCTRFFSRSQSRIWSVTVTGNSGSYAKRKGLRKEVKISRADGLDISRISSWELTFFHICACA